MRSDVYTLDEIAGLFRVTEKAVRGWIAAGMPVIEHGTQGGRRQRTKVSLEAATQWWFKANAERLELDRARTRLADEQARKLNLENTDRSKELGERKVWNREVNRFLAAIRDDLERFPAIAPRLGGTLIERRDVLETAVCKLLSKWASGT